MQRLVNEARGHEEAATRAREMMERAEAERREAERQASASQTLQGKLSAWWNDNTASRPTITAVSESKGDARIVTRQDGRTQVDTVGAAKISLVETPKTLPGGRLNASIDAGVTPGGNAASSVIRMSEGARDIGNVAPVRPGASE